MEDKLESDDDWEIQLDNKQNAAAQLPSGERVLIRQLMVSEVFTGATFDNLIQGLKNVGIENDNTDIALDRNPLEEIKSFRSHYFGGHWQNIGDVTRPGVYNGSLRNLVSELPLSVDRVSLSVISVTPSITCLTALFLFNTSSAASIEAAYTASYSRERRTVKGRELHKVADNLRVEAIANAYSALRSDCLSWLGNTFKGQFSREPSRSPACWVITTRLKRNSNYFEGRGKLLWNLGVTGFQLFKVSGHDQLMFSMDDSNSRKNGISLIGDENEFGSDSATRQVADVADSSEWWSSRSDLVDHYVSKLMCMLASKELLSIHISKLGMLRDNFGIEKIKLARHARGAADDLISLSVSAKTITHELLSMTADEDSFAWGIPTLDRERDHDRGGNYVENLRKSIVEMCATVSNLEETIRQVVPTVVSLRATAISAITQRVALGVSLCALAISILALVVRFTG